MTDSLVIWNKDQCLKKQSVLIYLITHNCNIIIYSIQVRPCDLMLSFECSEEIMTKRILDRAATSGRVDDNEETLKKRFASNKTETQPVIDHYDNLGKVAKARKAH